MVKKQFACLIAGMILTVIMNCGGQTEEPISPPQDNPPAQAVEETTSMADDMAKRIQASPDSISILLGTDGISQEELNRLSATVADSIFNKERDK